MAPQVFVIVSMHLSFLYAKIPAYKEMSCHILLMCKADILNDNLKIVKII